jgi:3-deoxy-D-manno-octulosonic-acid transferase
MQRMNALALRFYSLLMWLGQPLLRRKLARRGLQEPGYLDAVDERFGRYRQPAEAVSGLVWVHAVSLGETRTAAMLLQALRAQHPGLRLLLTHGTATGRAEGATLLQPGDVQVWHPWDSPAAVARFLDHFKPRLGLLMETEVWPNLVAAARARSLPLVLVNGRLSEKSLQQALRMAPLSRPAYGALSAVYAQTELDASRFRQLGAPVAGVFGNLKFDATPDAGQLAQGRAWRQALAQPVLMFASSREGEEDEFLKKIKALAYVGIEHSAIDSVAKSSPVAFKALIVPRHPQRFEQHGGGAGFAQRHGVHPDQRGRGLCRLRVAAKAFLHRLQIARLLQAAARQLAAQQRLAQPHQQRIKTQGQHVHALHASQACHTASTPGAGCANTLTCRPAGTGPVRQAVSKL